MSFLFFWACSAFKVRKEFYVTVVSELTLASDFPLLARILPEMMKTTRFLADLPLEKVILAKRCHYPQPRPPQTHPPTKATEGSHCASIR